MTRHNRWMRQESLWWVGGDKVFLNQLLTATAAFNHPDCCPVVLCCDIHNGQEERMEGGQVSLILTGVNTEVINVIEHLSEQISIKKWHQPNSAIFSFLRTHDSLKREYEAWDACRAGDWLDRKVRFLDLFLCSILNS